MIPVVNVCGLKFLFLSNILDPIAISLTRLSKKFHSYKQIALSQSVQSLSRVSLLTHNSYLHCKIMQNYFCLGFLSLTIIVHNDTIIDHNDTIKNHNDMVIDNNDSKIERGITSLNLYRIFVIVKSSTHLFTKKNIFYID